MNNVNYTNLSTSQNISPELRKRIVNQQNYGASSANQIKQDTLEVTNNSVQQDENFIFKGMRKLGCKDPKKTLKAIAGATLMVVGFAVVGNKSANKMADIGLDADHFLKNQDWFNALTSQYTKIKNSITNTLMKKDGNKFQSFVWEIADTVKNKAVKPVWDVARGYGQGFISIFSMTPVDILKKALNGKNVDEAQEILKDLVGEDKAKDFAQKILGENNAKITSNKEFCEQFSDAIRKQFNCENNNREFKKVLDRLEKGELCNGIFNNVTMKDKGLGAITGSWWPVNIINSIGSKITGKELNFGKGNLGNSLIKFNVVDNKLADTKIGSLIQKSILIPSESISNFVNDKSGMGFLISLGYISTLTDLQDTPKGMKASTLADDLVGTVGSIAVATPMALSTLYGLASLRNTEGKGIGRSIARGIGRVFSVGLKNKDATSVPGKILNGAKAYGGGIARFILLMFVLTPIFQKPVKGVINAIFGKPYNKFEEEKLAAQKAQMEAQANKIIPELGITQGEFIKKVQSNPKAIQELQNNPELVQKLQANPKLLLDYLDGKDIEKTSAQTTIQPNVQSARQAAVQQSTNVQQPLQAQQTNTNKAKSVDTATYIPSSKPAKQTINTTSFESDKINQALSRAERALANAQKYI